ncbi:carbohydrate ABC transporter permease [Spiroplasma clarkii]|nr:sugar ABC transporter permease [Spiroplasma clarkii]
MNKRKLSLEHKAEISEIYEKTPIIYSWWKVCLATVLTIILPGLGTLINKQFIKGALQILASVFFYILLLYAMGFGNIEGDGIFGLRKLGHADNLWEVGDARYFIIEGSLAVLFLTMFIMWNLINAYGTYKISIASKNGARVKTWTESKNYFTDIGYPVMTSIPTIAMLLVVVLIPIVTTFLLAFTNYKPNNAANFQWDGFNRFKEIFTPEWAETMQNIFGWTMIWTVFTWLSAFIISLTLATVLNNKRVKGKLLFRLIYVLPWAIPGFITILLFKIMFLPGSILSNFFGNDTFQSVPLYAKISVIMIQMWSGYCVNLVLITGILQSITTDLYEAAEIDGAKGSSKLFKITLPLIIYQMTPILVGQFMGAFNNFGIIYLYLDGGPYFTDVNLQGGAGATETIASLIYKLISAGKAGLASAMNIIVSGVIVAISVTILMRSKSVKGGVA